MCWEEVVIWAGRGLLYADKPTYRKAAPSKNKMTSKNMTSSKMKATSKIKKTSKMMMTVKGRGPQK